MADGTSAVAATGTDVLRRTLQTLDIAVAVADPVDWSIRFENASFFKWFPPTEESADKLAARLPKLDAGLCKSRLDQKRPYSYETEIKVGPRTISLRIVIRREEGDDGAVIIAECHNISKQKEAEYMLDSYSRISERNARELQKEKERVEKLLLNIMPRSVYEELKDFGTTTPQRFDSASVLMIDFVDFTEMAISQDPGALIAELNDIFSAFDRIVELFGCERIKTIGDGYVAVSGIPEVTPDHAANICKVALRMKRYLDRRNMSHPTQWTCRIGVATGPLIGSIVGIQKYVYDIFGPAVNLAARLEVLAEPMQILISDQTKTLIGDEFTTSPRGSADLKGFGNVPVHSLDFEAPGRR